MSLKTIPKLLVLTLLMTFNANCMQQNIDIKQVYNIINDFDKNIQKIKNNTNSINFTSNIMNQYLQNITSYITKYESEHKNRNYRSGYKQGLLFEVNNLTHYINSISKSFNEINKAITELPNLEKKVNELLPVFYNYLFDNIKKILSGNNTEEINYIDSIIQDKEVEYYITTGIIFESITKDDNEIKQQFHKEMKDKSVNKDEMMNRYMEKIKHTMQNYYIEIECFQNNINNINSQINHITTSQVNNIQRLLNKYLNKRKEYIEKISKQAIQYIRTNILLYYK